MLAGCVRLWFVRITDLSQILCRINVLVNNVTQDNFKETLTSS